MGGLTEKAEGRSGERDLTCEQGSSGTSWETGRTGTRHLLVFEKCARGPPMQRGEDGNSRAWSRFLRVTETSDF